MKRSRRAISNAALALLVVLRSATTARNGAAQSTSENAAQAETLFRDGRTLIKAGHTSEACAKFAESQRLDPQVGALLNLALCHEEEGKTASAWAEFNEVAERSLPKSERTEFALRHARAIEAKLSRLQVRVGPDVQGLEVTLDGRSLGRVALGSLIPLDPGDHTLEATAPGKERRIERIKLNAGPSTQEWAVTLADAPVAPSPRAEATPAGPAPSPLPAPSPVAPPPTGTSRTSLGFSIGAVGILGLGVGAGYGLQALSKQNYYKNSWPGGSCANETACAAAAETKSDLERAALISTIGFGVGAVAVATSLYLVLTAPTSKNSANSVRLAPMLAGPAKGVAIGGSF